MSAVAEKEKFTFQAEIKQLLHLLSHSLYQHREIAIRELVSNASDSLNKMRHIALTDSKHRDETPLEIVIEPDKEQRVLAIHDNGIGLTHEELIANLGTIAHSGSLEFLNKLSGDAKADLSLIGQFGVGFYSAFMLAERVEVITRGYRDEQGWRWESDGTGSYSIEPAESVPRGAQIRLHLKEGLDEFTDPQRLRHIIRKYSTFVPHPIKLNGEQLNEQRPIWVEPKSQLTEEQYHGFYQWLTHHTDEKPLWHLHLASDSPLQFHAILYCPPTNLELLGFGPLEHGLHLCAKRILVQDDCRELLPEYLRFLYGLVDSADLPLNVSRETLQDNSLLRKIRKVLTKRVLDHLADVAKEQPEVYRTFIQQFGPILRTGIGTDFENRDRIAKLLRFQSSQSDDPDALASLDEYIGRMGEKQTQIYFVTGPDLPAIRRNPNLEIFRKKKLEVLFLTDPIDEFVLSHLHTYDGKRLISIDAADVEFPEMTAGESTEEEQAQTTSKPTGFERVLDLFRKSLGDRVAEVRESKRLIDSPCCLVNPAGTVSAQLQKVLSLTSKDFEMSKQILEVNPSAPLIRRLCDLSSNSEHDGFIQDCGRQLYANAMLMEGLLPDPQDVVNRVQDFMSELAQKRSPIIT